MRCIRSDLRRQQGAFSVLSAMTLVMAILFLALVVDSGRLYLEQRKLQKLADTAALESISRLSAGNCALDTINAQLYAQQNATSYGFPGSDLQSLTSSCASITIIDGLRVPTVDAGGRAVRVVTSSQVPASIIVRTGGLFGIPGNSTVRLQAVAVAEKDSDPMTVFSVGSQLLDLNGNGLVPRLLKVAGVDVNGLTLLDSEGLANAQITPGGLLQALGVNVGINQLKALTPKGLAELVDTQVGVIGIQELIDISAKLVTKNETLAADIKAFGEELVGTQLESATVNLLGTADRPGLLQLTTGPNQAVGSALDAKLNLSDVLSTGLMTAVQGRGLLMDQLNLLNGTLAVKLGIVEPPAFGIGPVGTTAYNAQTRIQVDANTDNLPGLGPLLKFLGVSLKLPVIIDLANARGELTNIDCSRSEPEATIDVESRIGNVCIGSMPANTLWSTKGSCTEANLQETTVLKLLNIDLIKGKAAIPLLSTGNSPIRDVVTLAEEEFTDTGVNNLALGSSIKELLQKVLNLIKVGLPAQGGAPGFTETQATQIADKYLSANGNDKTRVKNALISDGLDWVRPAGLLDTTMATKWHADCLSGSCRNTLITALQTKAQGGTLSSVVGGVFKLVGNIVNGLTLGLLGLGGDSQPLLLKILDPVLTLLEPLLNSVGTAVSNLLSSLGLELGKSEIKVHSISCGIPRLVQ